MKSSLFILISVMSLAACSGKQTREITIAELSKNTLKFDEPKVNPLNREDTSDLYRKFLAKAPPGAMYGDALRRLADLELQSSQELAVSTDKKTLISAHTTLLSAIRLYETFLDTYPNHVNNDLVLYQLAKAYELNFQQEKLLATLNKLVSQYPDSRHIEEAQFRRGETYFVLGNYKLAEEAYRSILLNYAQTTYTEKSLYKYGWTQFKQLAYPQATKSFLELLNKKYTQGQLLQDGPAETLSRTDKELLNDVLRVISLSFSYQEGHASIKQFFANNGHQPYESMIYNTLAEYYLEKGRIRDAATTFLSYSSEYPTSSFAPKYHSKAIDAYKSGGFSSLVLPAKISFVNQYGVNTPYWKVQDERARKQITPLIKQHIKELANHYHANARKSSGKDKKSKLSESDFKQAISWYNTYINSFPADIETSDINFLLAEAYQDAGQHQQAIQQFENTAYLYPSHAKQNNAAYAALLLYPSVQEKLTGTSKTQWQQKKISSAIKYSEHFPDSKHTPSILANTASELFAISDYNRATNLATQLSATTNLDKELLISALLVIGHSQFELKNYEKSELAYKELSTKLSNTHKEYNNVQERLAASIYKQGEQAKNLNQLALAASFYLRVGKEVPSSTLRSTADYDAATIYVQLELWPKAKSILLDFRKNYTKENKFQQGVTEKLALIYNKTGEPVKAADEMVYLSQNATNYTRDQRRELLWDAAVIYKDNNLHSKSKPILKSYIKNHPAPLEQAIEARLLLAEFNQKTNQKKYYYWLREVIKADNSGGKNRTPHTQFLAANAYMQLTLPLFNAYKSARLTIPLKTSLKKKKSLMQKVVKSYDNAMKYRVAEITTSATYHIAEIYNDFAGSLLQSQRPKKLTADELEQYNVLLEEQAFPFEEKAIDIHVANAARVKDNIYDKWVKLSIAALSKLNPIRYSKTEKGEAYVESVN